MEGMLAQLPLAPAGVLWIPVTRLLLQLCIPAAELGLERGDLLLDALLAVAYAGANGVGAQPEQGVGQVPALTSAARLLQRRRSSCSLASFCCKPWVFFHTRTWWSLPLLAR